jgi:16S rRNA (cytosine967-C5)-methyltransferase
MSVDTRVAAARCVAGVLAGRSLDAALAQQEQAVDPRDRPLLAQLCYGTLRLYPRLSGLLRQLLERPLRGKDRDVESLLLVALYQLEAMRVPDHAAVSTAVDATRALRKAWARGLVNGVLRRFIRERGQLQAHLSSAEQAACPEWLYRALGEAWPDEVDRICAVASEQPPMTLRVNTSRLTRAEYLAQLEAAGIGARAGSLSPAAITLERPVDVSALPGFAEGQVSVQDEAAQLAAALLAPADGMSVLDACAAPGGKTGHLLELAPQARVTAADISEGRLARVRENLDRLGLTATTLAVDMTDPRSIAQLGTRAFDRILLDVPCSASGVIRRHPDIKVLRRAADIAAFAERQGLILRSAWERLGDGGQLLYVTCSILPAENEAVIGAFLATHPEAREIPIAAGWGLERASGRQLLPETGGPDGLYFALLGKSG